MPRYVVREPNLEDVKEDLQSLCYAVGAMLSNLRQSELEARTQIRISRIVALLAFLSTLASLWLSEESYWILGCLMGGFALLGWFDGFSYEDRIRRMRAKCEGEVRSYGFDADWSDADFNGKQWATVYPRFLPVDEFPD